MEMSEIFISHATADKALVKAMVSLLRKGMGVPKKSIFCTSLSGHGIPLGKDFNVYMKAKIQQPKMVIMMITPAYLESQFCLMETGAVWSKSLNPCPIIVPPVSYSAITKTLGLVQGWTITDSAGLIDFKGAVNAALSEYVSFEEIDEHDWMDAREVWIEGLPEILDRLASATVVSSKDHQEAQDRIEVQKRKAEALKYELAEKETIIRALKAAKDKQEVVAIEAQYDDEVDEFEGLIEAVKSAKPEHAYRVIFLHFLMDHFDKAPDFDWFNNKDELQEALDYNLISADEDGTVVNWDERKMRKLCNAIEAVASFADAYEGKKYLESLGEDIPIDPSNKAFWEYHLDL